MFYQQDQNRFVEVEYDQIPLTVLEHFDWPSLPQSNISNNGHQSNNNSDYEYLDEDDIVPSYSNVARKFRCLVFYL